MKKIISFFLVIFMSICVYSEDFTGFFINVFSPLQTSVEQLQSEGWELVNTKDNITYLKNDNIVSIFDNAVIKIGVTSVDGIWTFSEIFELAIPIKKEAFYTMVNEWAIQHNGRIEGEFETENNKEVITLFVNIPNITITFKAYKVSSEYYTILIHTNNNRIY